MLIAAATLATAIAIPATSFADSSTGCDFVIGTTPSCTPPLSPSTFEGGDGNLVPNTAGNTDWSTVAGLHVGIDVPSGPTDNSFGQGTKEDNPNVTVVTGSIPPQKSDLTRFYAASEFVGGAGGGNFLYLAWERTNVLGSANMDFEINQAKTPNLGTPGTHTINRTAGDLLVTFDFTNGGGKPTLGLLKWVTSGPASQCFSSSTVPCWGDHVNLNGTDSEGAVNNLDSVNDPIAPNAPRTLAAGTFGEAAINLTAAGVFPPGTCEALGSAFVKSRSSASFGSEVKDFIAPVDVSISNCGTIKITKVTENGNATFGYTTTGGLTPPTFNLMGGQTQTYGPGTVLPGPYSVTESTVPAGWTLKNLVCTATGSGTTESTSLATATASITMAPEGEVDCTYTNHTNFSPTITTTLSSSTISAGDSAHDSATLTGATGDAGGTVKYTVYSNSACTQNPVDAGTVTVTNGSVPDSNAVMFNTAGTFYWQAHYSGDANNNPATSACTSETLVVKANPSITTTLSSNTISAGDSAHDSATLAGATADASGTVTYTVYTDASCSQNPVGAGTKTVTGGVVPDSNAVMFNTAGTFYWQAHYSGDAHNNPATSACTSETLVVKANPSIATTLSASTISAGDSAHDSATLTGATGDAGGTVTYTVYSDSACTLNPVDAGTVTVTSGSVPDSNAVMFNTAGTFFWQAHYSGDAHNNGATSACTSETLVVKANPSIATTLSASMISIGGSVHDSATLTGATGDAGGTVTYTVYTNASCSLNPVDAGTKTVTGGLVPDSNAVTFNHAGTFYWQAHYSGDAHNNPATSACTSETLLVSPNQPGINTAQNLIPNDDATISGATSGAGGSITFNLFGPSDATCSGTPALTQTVNVNGNGKYSTTNTTFIASTNGTWRWQVTYTGDPDNLPATSACGVENFTITNG